MTFKLLFNDPDKRLNANKLQVKLSALTNKYRKSCELPKVNTNHGIRQETRFSAKRRLELTLNGVSKVSKIVLTRHVGASLLNECVLCFFLLLLVFSRMEANGDDVVPYSPKSKKMTKKKELKH